MKDDAHLKWVFNQTCAAIDAYNHSCNIPSGELVQEAINTNNEELAKKLCEEYNLCSDFLEN